MDQITYHTTERLASQALMDSRWDKLWKQIRSRYTGLIETITIAHRLYRNRKSSECGVSADALMIETAPGGRPGAIIEEISNHALIIINHTRYSVLVLTRIAS